MTVCAIDCTGKKASSTAKLRASLQHLVRHVADSNHANREANVPSEPPSNLVEHCEGVAPHRRNPVANHASAHTTKPSRTGVKAYTAIHQ